MNNIVLRHLCYYFDTMSGLASRCFHWFIALTFCLFHAFKYPFKLAFPGIFINLIVLCEEYCFWFHSKTNELSKFLSIVPERKQDIIIFPWFMGQFDPWKCWRCQLTQFLLLLLLFSFLVLSMLPSELRQRYTRKSSSSEKRCNSDHK